LGKKSDRRPSNGQKNSTTKTEYYERVFSGKGERVACGRDVPKAKIQRNSLLHFA